MTRLERTRQATLLRSLPRHALRRPGAAGLAVLAVALLGVVAPAARAATFSGDSLGYPWARATTLDAATNDYGYATCPSNDPGCKGATLRVNGITYGQLDPLEYFLRNCTSWASFRLTHLGVPAALVENLGNGGQWGASAAARGLAVDGVPRAGDAAVVLPTSANPFGHVAVVESVNADGTITVSEYNRIPNGAGDRGTGTPSAMGFRQFVHFPQSEAALRGANAPQAVRASAISATGAAGAPGYWVVSPAGAVDAFGSAAYHGGLAAAPNAPITGIVSTVDGGGYYLLGADGGIFSFGDATFLGGTGGMALNQPVVAMALTPDGGGYWLVARDGGIFSFGDANFFGSTGALHLNRPVVGLIATPTGQGYSLVAADGGIFSFGDAGFFGSTGAMRLNAPIVGITAGTGGQGYRLVASDGGIFSFGDAPFSGSLGATPPAAPVDGMAPTADGAGYYLLDQWGRVYAFGDAVHLGDAFTP